MFLLLYIMSETFTRLPETIIKIIPISPLLFFLISQEAIYKRCLVFFTADYPRKGYRTRVWITSLGICPRKSNPYLRKNLRKPQKIPKGGLNPPHAFNWIWKKKSLNRWWSRPCIKENVTLYVPKREWYRNICRKKNKEHIKFWSSPPVQ